MAQMEVGQIGRAVRGMTLNVLSKTQRATAERELEGLAEYEEAIRVDVAGRAEEFPIWSEVHLAFDALFIDATGQRDTEFDRPLFTYGSYIEKGGPIGLMACVTRWDVTDRNEVNGCMLAVGVVASDHGRKFRGELHALFRGYGMPEDAYGDQPNLE